MIVHSDHLFNHVTTATGKPYGIWLNKWSLCTIMWMIIYRVILRRSIQMRLKSVLKHIDENMNKRPKQFMLSEPTLEKLEELRDLFIQKGNKHSYSQIVENAINAYCVSEKKKRLME